MVTIITGFPADEPPNILILKNNISGTEVVSCFPMVQLVYGETLIDHIQALMKEGTN